MKDSKDVDHEVTRRLVDLVGDERPPLEVGRPNAGTDIFASSTGEREDEDAVDVVEDLSHEPSSGISRRLLSDPIVEVMKDAAVPQG
ncbi:hypothetical protein [Nocardioides sp.]|uniref:hypothetical protein n=1 Tax=Nocardioides sp. TaxID=35761 RepID=UPI00321BE67A